MGEYATARSTTFSFLGHKVLYLPWSVFPVKTERQSGFLLPQFQLSSRDGTIFRNAYYWAIAKDKDATFFLDWIQERGVKPGAEYRYSLTDTTKGHGTPLTSTTRNTATTLPDKGAARADVRRHELQDEHQSRLRLDYLQDLGLTTLERSESSLRDVAFIEKPFPRSLLTVEADYFQDLTQKDNGDTLQYLPSASYFTEYLPLLQKQVYGDVTSDLTNFTRS